MVKLPRNYILINYYCRQDFKCGGVALFLRKDFSMEYEVLDLSNLCESKTFETVGIKLTKLRIILISIYCSPETSTDIFLDKLDLLFNVLKNFSQYRLIIIGDININVLKSCSDVNKFKSVLSSMNFIYLND